MRRILLTAVLGYAAALMSSFVPPSHVVHAQAPAARPGTNGSDLRDLVTYLREKCGTFPTDAGGGGCFDERNPPANPRYKAK